MDATAHRLMYDNIHDFKTTAAHVESEIKRLEIRHDRNDVVPSVEGRRHRDMWVSMKSVSHFNLGVSLELLLKVILLLNDIQYDHVHPLAGLYDLMPKKFQKQLDSVYESCRMSAPDDLELLAFVNSATEDVDLLPELENRDVKSIRGVFEYFDKDVMLSKKRYSWELIGSGQWRHYVSDISVFTMLIDEVMADIPRYESD